MILRGKMLGLMVGNNKGPQNMLVSEVEVQQMRMYEVFQTKYQLKVN